MILFLEWKHALRDKQYIYAFHTAESNHPSSAKKCNCSDCLLLRLPSPFFSCSISKDFSWCMPLMTLGLTCSLFPRISKQNGPIEIPHTHKGRGECKTSVFLSLSNLPLDSQTCPFLDNEDIAIPNVNLISGFSWGTSDHLCLCSLE